MAQKESVVYAERPHDDIMVVYLNQPEKKNAISAPMMDLLDEILRHADLDDGIRVIVLRGVGEIFSSGGDLSPDDQGVPGPENARKTLRRYLTTVRTVRAISKPVIAMVDGYAVGGAFALTLACDMVCASSRALFVPAFCQIGIIPEMGMMKYLPELVGAQRAKEILFLGGKYSAEQLHGWGLLNRVVAAESLEQETFALADQVASMPDASIQITKSIMNSISDGNLDACLESEATASPFCTTTAAYKKTMERFKR